MTDPLVTPEAFAAVCEGLHAFIRTPEKDRPHGLLAQMQHASFCNHYPEVNDLQFAYAAEEWKQATTPGEFTRFPKWDQLMAHLYRCDGNGLPVRAAGFKPDLPAYVQPTAQQLAMLPSRDEIDRTPPGANPEAYRIVSFPRPNGMLPEGYR